MNAQDKSLDKYFMDNLNPNKLIYKQPEFYFALDSVQDYDPTPNYLHTLLSYSIKKEEDDIIIAFAVIEIQEPKEMITKMFPKSKEINNIVPYLITEADSTVSIPIKIDEKKRKELNADDGYIYNLKIVYPYLGKYPLCRKVFIHKDNVSNAEILYFYTKKDEDKVDDVIQKTWGMLKFEK
jgi:hypothetical protein